jgi:lipopolysaccharide assembly outer membrane protein LptD (OstA)
LKIWLFIIFVLSVSLAATIAIIPQSRERERIATMAQIEFENYRFSDIGVNGVANMMIATSGRHFDDREEFSNPVLMRQSGTYIDSISANSGIYQNDILTLNGNISYYDSLGRMLRTEQAIYSKNEALLKGGGGFELESAEGRMRGSNFEVDMQSRVIKAKDIEATVETDVAKM